MRLFSHKLNFTKPINSAINKLRGDMNYIFLNMPAVLLLYGGLHPAARERAGSDIW